MKQGAVSCANNRTDLIDQNLVYMHNVSVHFGKVIALDGVNFRVGHGEIVGLIGDNGVGKTTLAKALIGHYRIASGEVFFRGERVDFKTPREARLAGIETGYQDLALIDMLSVTRNFFLGREIYRPCGLMKVLDQKKMDEVVYEQLAELNFDHKIDTHEPVSSLSGGERQVVAIARALYFAAKLLILDEPTSALTEHEVSPVLKMVTKAKSQGMSVVFITHKVSEVFQVADRFVVLQQGRNYADFYKEDTNLQELEKLFIHSRLTVMHEMAASIAHQVRNPLAVMKVSVEMLKEIHLVKEKEEKCSEILQLLLDEINSLQRVVNNFLDFSKPLKSQKMLVSVEQTIRAALGSLPLSRFDHVQLGCSIQKGIEYLMDPSLMQQAIGNLVMNALEASQEHGKVEVRAFMETNRLCIEVQDWGTGIDEETRQRIFGFFFTTKKRGAGLGLAIVHRIVEQHNGAIVVHSTPGLGSLFRIVL
jgi:simple sugar transport system ATP-binding protein